MQLQPVTKPLGTAFIELASIDSTNNYALSRVREGLAEHGTVYFAHEQVAGKGQMGRQWISEKGANIAMSIVIQPAPLLVSQQFQLSACVATAVVKFFSQYAGDDMQIKWPNDIYWKDRKAGGILIENIIAGKEGWQWAIAGIGLNINQTLFSPDLPNPVSLKQITGKNLDTVQLAKELCTVVNEYYAMLMKKGFEKIFKEYNQNLYRLNETVKLKKNNTAFQTTIKGVSETGELITHNAKMEERFSFGEVRWVM